MKDVAYDWGSAIQDVDVGNVDSFLKSIKCANDAYIRGDNNKITMSDEQNEIVCNLKKQIEIIKNGSTLEKKRIIIQGHAGTGKSTPK